ncbi:MAG: response regulator [Alkalispirochaetaceae bacterium]
MDGDLIQGASILVVDDNPANLGVLYQFLSRAGYRVLAGQDGEAGLEMAEREQPDLILMDVMLPGEDGFSVCRKLQEREKTAPIPVIFVTALTQVEDKLAGFDAGGVDYITKPFQREEVLARIGAHLTIKKQAEELTRANASKDRFFSILAHDLRGPFGGLLNATELLATSAEAMSTDQVKEMAHTLHGSAKQTYDLLEKLLEWSRLQNNTIRPEPSQFSLALAVRETAEIYAGSLADKSIELHLDLQELEIEADRYMFETTVRNLLNNAVKFTPDGGRITVSSSRERDEAFISVSDTGIGMDEQTVSRLFDVGTTSRREGSRGESGSGLGLLLVGEYVEKNRGRIEVVSEEGSGSRFTFSVPLSEAEAASLRTSRERSSYGDESAKAAH